MEIVITLPKPHTPQRQILSESKRFNVVCNGRRWGKTTLSVRLMKEALTKGWIIGYFAPTYKDLEEVWRDAKNRLHEATKRKNEQTKQIELLNGGIIDFWSMDDPNSGRGRKYHRAIMDEVEKAKKFKEAWEQTIRPTLTDFEGDGWMLSTPKGVNSYFHTLYKNHERYDNWMSWQMPSVTNPYLNPNEIDEAESQLDPIIFKQEYLAEFVTLADKPFMYCFEEKHIGTAQLNPNQTTYLSFDFNVDPITCIVAQHDIDQIRVLDEFRLRNSDLYEICAQIKARYGEYLHYIVTGDASGMSRSVLTKGNLNNYHIIMQELRLSRTQLRVPSHNPPITESRTLCNAIFARHPNLVIDKKCKYLIEDLRFVQVKDDGSIDKTSDQHKSHLLDAYRYYINSFHSAFIAKN